MIVRPGRLTDVGPKKNPSRYQTSSQVAAAGTRTCFAVRSNWESVDRSPNITGTRLNVRWSGLEPASGVVAMAKKKYGAKANSEVKKAVKKTKAGTQKSGKRGKAKSRKQAIAIGLSKARKKGAKVPKKKSS
jgi:hypothetical protein